MPCKEIKCQCNQRTGVGHRSDHHKNTPSPNDINKNSSDIELHFGRALGNLIKPATKLSIKVLHYPIFQTSLKISCEAL